MADVNDDAGPGRRAASVKLQQATGAVPAELGWWHQFGTGDTDGVQAAVQVILPEPKKPHQHRKPGRHVLVLPDIALQQGGMIGAVIDDLRRRQPIAVQKTLYCQGIDLVVDPRHPQKKSTWAAVADETLHPRQEAFCQ